MDRRQQRGGPFADEVDAATNSPAGTSVPVATSESDSALAVAALAENARERVGAIGLRVALKTVRAAMVREALARTGHNHHATARLLHVDRRYILKLVRDAE